MLKLAPENVRQDRIPAEKVNRPSFPWAEGDMLRGSEAALFRNLDAMTSNGVYGEPAAGNVQLGEALIEVISTRLAAILNDLAVQNNECCP
jgi:creatinine amidohydrolase/Fe(II)-dependent formamide hydrolase-like protein